MHKIKQQIVIYYWKYEFENNNLANLIKVKNYEYNYGTVNANSSTMVSLDLRQLGVISNTDKIISASGYGTWTDTVRVDCIVVDDYTLYAWIVNGRDFSATNQTLFFRIVVY